MKIFLFIFFTVLPTLAYADITINVDTLYIVNPADSDLVDKVYRVEIKNNTDSEYLFFISPTQCSNNSVDEKFKDFLCQEIGPGLKMMHIIYEGNMVYNSKFYSKRNLLKIIPPNKGFVCFVLNSHNLKSILDQIVTMRISDVETILKTKLNKELLYPYSEVVWPN